MYEMTCIFGNFAFVFEKRQKYVGNDVDLWEKAQISGEMTII